MSLHLKIFLSVLSIDSFGRDVLSFHTLGCSSIASETQVVAKSRGTEVNSDLTSKDTIVRDQGVFIVTVGSTLHPMVGEGC